MPGPQNKQIIETNKIVIALLQCTNTAIHPLPTLLCGLALFTWIHFNDNARIKGK
jgi:hypothetical protein